MEDVAQQLLQSELLKCQTPVLVVADEAFSLSVPLPKDAPLTFISNRFDIAEDLRQRGLNSVFSDFEFEHIDTPTNKTGAPIEQIYYRVSKEKAITHHVINSAYKMLPAGGKLWLSGYKNEGIKTYLGKAEAVFGKLSTTYNGGKTARIGALEKTTNTSDLLDDKRYTELRPVFELAERPCYSKPGLFGWDKIDQGSAFLIEHLEDFLANEKPSSMSMLDLGCGYGYLSIMASTFGFKSYVATDSNAAAIQACIKNLEHLGASKHVIADHCGQSLREPFDVILCNPPFHRGFETEPALTQLFLAQTRRLLKPQGRALFVVNQFIPLEKLAAGSFKSIKITAKNKSFKLVSLAL